MSEVKWEDLEIVGGESAVLHNSCDLEAIFGNCASGEMLPGGLKQASGHTNVHR